MNAQKTSRKTNSRLKLVVFIVIALLAGIAYAMFHDKLSLEYLAEQEQQLRAFQSQNPLVVYGAAFVIYVAITGLSLPGATVLTLVYGWYFGLLRGFLLVSIASTSGATLAFQLSRYLLREIVQSRFGERLKVFNENLKKDGAFYLFTLRLIAGVPFFVINVVMGLTPMKVWTFWWVSQLGMIPGTVLYVYAGSSVPGLQKLADAGIQAVFSTSQLIQILIAFALLGLFPLVVKFGLKHFGNRSQASEVQSSAD